MFSYWFIPNEDLKKKVDPLILIYRHRTNKALSLSSLTANLQPSTPPCIPRNSAEWMTNDPGSSGPIVPAGRCIIRAASCDTENARNLSDTQSNKMQRRQRYFLSFRKDYILKQSGFPGYKENLFLMKKSTHPLCFITVFKVVIVLYAELL